jgi:hypothetical protein
MARALSVRVVTNRIPEVSEKLRRRAREEQQACANRIYERARVLVPVRTGALRASIVIDTPRATGSKPEGERTITVSAGMFYAPFVESYSIYLVRAIAQGASYDLVESAADSIDRQMTTTVPTEGLDFRDIRIARIDRDQPHQRKDDENGVPYVYLGNTYRVWFTHPL